MMKALILILVFTLTCESGSNRRWVMRPISGGTAGSALGASGSAPSGGLSSIPQPPSAIPSGATQVPANSTLSWAQSNGDTTLVTYNVYMDTFNPPTTLVRSGLRQPSWTPPDTLLYNTTYYWKVVAIDSLSTVTTTNAWSFTTAKERNIAPNAPSVVSPAWYSVGQVVTPTLTWTDSDPNVIDTLKYDVFFGTDSLSLPQVGTNQRATTLARTGLSYSTKYYWRVTAKDDSGATHSGALWSFTTGPPPTYKIYAVHNSSTSYSRDNGASWTNPSANKYGRSISVRGANIYLGGDNNGFWRSSDSGATYTNVVGPFAGKTMDCILSVNATVSIVSIIGQGVYRSTDNGATWGAANATGQLQFAMGIAMYGTDIYVVSQTGLNKSTDNGANWTTVLGGPAGRSIVSTPGAIFIGGMGAIVYRSTDNGASWQSASLSAGTSVPSIAASGSTVYAGTYDNGVYKSTDNGVTFSPLTTGINPAYQCISAFAIGSKVFIGTNGGSGLYYSGDSGASWNSILPNGGTAIYGISGLTQ